MTHKGYSCCGGNGCCGPADRGGLDRRSFLKTAAVVAGSAGLLSSVEASGSSGDSIEAWKASLRERGERRIYHGAELERIAMPHGGFGAGQVYLTGRGALSPWQMVNNFNLHADVEGGFFAVRTKRANGAIDARVLHEGDLSGLPGVTAVEFSGEYPYGWLRYLDGSLPVTVNMKTYSPFIPQNGKDSALPAVLFEFTVRNTSDERLSVDVLGSVPNLAGWDGYSPIDGVSHLEFDGNTAAFSTDKHGGRLSMGAVPGKPDRMGDPINLYTNSQSAAYRLRDTEGVWLHWPAGLPESAGAGDVLWLNDASRELGAESVASIRSRIENGATLILSGFENSVLAQIDQLDNKTVAHVFADFEDGTYEGWTVTGDAFGSNPATGAIGNQNPVSGWAGKYFINTYSGTDGTTGTATSRPFAIKERYIHFLVGGGKHGKQTCVNLRIGGEVVDSASGTFSEHLNPVTWDVGAYASREATIEIVDDHTEGWGHILVDHIVFSASPAIPFLDKHAAEAVAALLPFTWNRLTPVDGAAILVDGVLCQGMKVRSHTTGPFWQAEGLSLGAEAEVLLRSADGIPLIVSGRVGAGRVIVAFGEPQNWIGGFDGKTLIGNLAAYGTGTTYTAQTGLAPTDAHFGTMALAVLDDGQVSATDWTDSGELWEAFTRHDAFPPHETVPSPAGQTHCGALRSSFDLKPGESCDLTFVLTWHFPNRMRDDRYGWGPAPMTHDYRLGNRYATWFGDADAVLDYVLAERTRLADETRLFHETFYASTLPRYFLDAVTANAAIVCSPVYVWLEDGTVGGFEGADSCCPMNCTHVFNYVMTTGFLFPEWERNVRETDLLVQMHPTKHYIPHRTVLPLSLDRLGFEIGGPHHPALDGELGTLLKTYREFRLCGDKAWLGSVWDRARTHLRYLMATHDPDGSGVIQGEQPNTYDIHTYGSNTFIGSLYLAALRSMEEMAGVMGDGETETLCRERFALSSGGYDRKCWNGEYYYNVFDAPDATEDTYNQGNCWGPGCHADQLFGQYWAHLLGLGHLLPQDRIRSALSAIFQYNFKYTFLNHHHNQRVFAEGDEKGLLNCTWPKSGRPDHPVFYCDEVWTGLEYHVATTMLYEGMVDEALQLVRGARDRYTGDNRNPWAELECGYHYTRAMSSYGLLHGAAGLSYDRASGALHFAPRFNETDFRCFFSAGTGWGTVGQVLQGDGAGLTIAMAYGEAVVHRIEWPAAPSKTGHCRHNGRTVPFTRSDTTFRLESPVTVRAGETLHISL